LKKRLASGLLRPASPITQYQVTLHHVTLLHVTHHHVTPHPAG